MKGFFGTKDKVFQVPIASIDKTYHLSYHKYMKYFDWNSQKNKRLQDERDISFEQVVIAIDEGDLLEVLEHKNQKKYPDQKVFIIKIEEYAYLVPFVEDEDKIFLKTIIPSRQATKKYIMNKRKK